MATSAGAATRTTTRAPRGMDMEAVAAKHQKAAEDLQRRNEAGEKTSAKIKETVAAFQVALQKGDIDQTKILEATFESANADHRKVTRDVASVLMALKDSSNDLGIVLKTVQERNESEQAIPDAAAAVLAAKEAALRVAQDDLVKAGKAWFKESAEKSAKTAIAQAEAEIALAKDAVKTANQMAEQMRRERLQSLSLDQSIQELSSITQQVIGLARDRIADIQENLASVKAGREEISSTLKSEAVKREKLEASVHQAQAELNGLRDQQKEHIENSPEWVDLKTQIEAKQSELTAIEADHNKAFTLLNDGQRFMQMYHLQEQAQQEALGFHQIWIATLESGERERAILYTSYLGLVKAAGDQQMMSDVDGVATQNDEDISLVSSQHLAAMRSNALARGQALTGQIRRHSDINEAASKSKASYADGMAKLADEFKKLYDETAGHTDPQNYKPEESGTPSSAQ